MHDQSAVTTFLFTDIEGSSRLWEEEPERMRGALAHHDRILREAVTRNRGVVVKTTGDGLHATFRDPRDAVAATVELQIAVGDPAATGGLPLRVRCGIHAGAVERRDGDYFGSAVNRAARIMSAAHGGQVLLSQAVAQLLSDRLPEGVTLRDLGKARLRDLSRPEQMYQVEHEWLRPDFPALRSLEATPNNLPHQVTSFVGRERELAEVRKLLAQARLVTLLGVGGLGKTRLSLQVAAEAIDDFPDGVWFVELAPLADARLVPQAVASVLGVKEEAGRPLVETLAEHVVDRKLLVVLDNCEHLGQACAELVKRMLHAGPQLKAMASSREPLHVTGETTYRLAPLSVPDSGKTMTAEALARSEAVRLFVDRAIAAQPTFEVTRRNADAVADICRRLEGIPLALELAAARVHALSVESIAARLSDRFRLLTGGDRVELPRQRTMRACIDWSYELLAEPERALLRRLTVFAGWTLEAAEAVTAGSGIASAGVLDLLVALVEKSLVTLDAEGQRYRLLETVRQYGRQLLLESGEEAQWQERHLAHFLQVAEEAEPHLTGAEQQRWLERLEAEHDNLRAALEWSATTNADAGLRLAGALWRFWYVRGYLDEGLRRLSAALVAPAKIAGEVVAARAKALHGAAEFARQQGDYPAALALNEESLAIRRELGDRRGTAISIGNLGNLAYDQGDYATARARHEESLAIRREINDRWGIAASLNNLGIVASDTGDFATARALHEESSTILRELGDRWAIANSLDNLGVVTANSGDYGAARSLYEEGLAIRRELGDRQGIANSLSNLGLVESAEGRHEAARALHKESLAIRQELGDRTGIVWPLEGLAYVALALGGPRRAARIWGRVELLRDEFGSPLAPSERPRYERQLAEARAALGDDAAFESAWREGRAMTVVDIVRYAVQAQDADG